MHLYRHESSYPLSNAQKNLAGRTLVASLNAPTSSTHSNHGRQPKKPCGAHSKPSTPKR
jgi:hypothetical protein